MTCCQGPYRARVLRLFDARTAGRRPLTTGAGGAFHSALLRWLVSRASGVDSEQARVVRISSTLLRDTTCACHPSRYLGVPRLFLAAPPSTTALGLHSGQGEQCVHS